MAREMKNSGVRWIGDIPKDWSCQRLKFSLSANDGGVWGNDPQENGNNTIVLRSTEQTIDGKWDIQTPAERYLHGISNYRVCMCKEGDLLVTKSSGSKAHIGKTSLVTKEIEEMQCCYSNFLQRLHLQKGRNDKYFWYLLNSNVTRLQFGYRQNDTSGIGNINSSDIDSIIVPLPPLAEQKAIADFLDAKCGEIDGLLSDLDAEVKTLAEYKKSLIAETVARGLNPNVPMKSSGIPLADTIPAHWNVQKGKYTFTLLQRPVKEDDGVITCFRDGEVTLRSNRREEGFTMSAKEYGYQGIEPGDLVVHGMDGFAGSIGISDSRGKATPVLNVLDSEHNKRYLMYYLRNMAYGDVFLSLSTGIRVRSCDLGWKKLGEIRIVIPPLSEQKAIADFLDTKCAAIDQAIADKTTQIETLKAYKSSLIYEYVTGKKQVL